MCWKLVFPLFALGTIAPFWVGCASNDQKENAGTNTGTSRNSLSPEKGMKNEEIFKTKYDMIERVSVGVRELIVKSPDDEQSFKATVMQIGKLYIDTNVKLAGINKMFPGYFAEEPNICMQYIEKVGKEEIEPMVQGDVEDEKLMGTLKDALLRLQILSFLTGIPSENNSASTALRKYMNMANAILTGKFQPYKKARMIVDRLELFVSVVFSSDKNVALSYKYFERVLDAALFSAKRSMSAIADEDSIGKDSQLLGVLSLFTSYEKGFGSSANIADNGNTKNEKVQDSESRCLTDISEVLENPNLEDEQVKIEIKKLVDQSVSDLTQIGSEDSSAQETAMTAGTELKTVLEKLLASLESKET